MSTTYESKTIIGYKLSIDSLIELMKKIDNTLWNEDFFSDNKGYHAIIAECFSEEYGLYSVYDIEGNIFIGYEVEFIEYDKALNFINSKSLELMNFLEIVEKPKLMSCIFSY